MREKWGEGERGRVYGFVVGEAGLVRILANHDGRVIGANTSAAASFLGTPTEVFQTLEIDIQQDPVIAFIGGLGQHLQQLLQNKKGEKKNILK